MDGDLCEHYNSLDPSKRRNIAEELDRTPAEVKKQDNRRGRAQEGRAGRGEEEHKWSGRGEGECEGGAEKITREGGGREGRNSEILVFANVP